MTATAAGYEPDTQEDIAVADDDTTTVNFSLTEYIHPPEAPGDVTITLSKEDIRLDWSAVTVDTAGNSIVADSYYVYRDTVSFFFPGSLPFDAVVHLYSIDTSGAVGDTAVHYYYSISAVSGGMESELSGVVGEFDKKTVTGTK